jgi:ubiquinone/menaquinone biosynthesis C-methylase UbiE
MLFSYHPGKKWVLDNIIGRRLYSRVGKETLVVTKGNTMSDRDDTTAEQEKLQLIQSRFGAVAADYVTSKVHASGQDLTWLVEAAALTGNERVLDVATGGGHAAFALAPSAREVVALDLTRQMLEMARQEAIARQLANISYLEGNAQAIPCEDETFDVVVCRQAAHHFPRWEQGIQEWARVLKPGGKLLVVDSVSPEEPEFDLFLNEIEILRDPSHVRNHRISEWQSQLIQAGFTLQEVQEQGIYLDIPSWTQRMRTPSESVAIIEQLLCTASPALRARLKIEEKDGVLGFTLPIVLVHSVKTV